MGTISALKRGLDTLNLPSEILAIIERTKGELIKLNQSQLYSSSQDSLGQPLPAYRNKRYEAYKATINTGKTDLKLYGGFYDGFEVTVETSIFTISSTDEKANKLELKYGKYIFGINKANKTIYALEVFYPELQKYITEKTGLLFR